MLTCAAPPDVDPTGFSPASVAPASRRPCHWRQDQSREEETASNPACKVARMKKTWRGEAVHLGLGGPPHRAGEPLNSGPELSCKKAAKLAQAAGLRQLLCDVQSMGVSRSALAGTRIPVCSVLHIPLPEFFPPLCNSPGNAKRPRQ